jgi:hypothetical protein
MTQPETFGFKPMRGHLVTVRLGAFAGWVAMIHKDRDSRRLVKMSDRDYEALMERVEVWLKKA